MPATLYAVPASHPCATVEAALRHKALPYRRLDLPPPVHVPVQTALFGRRTVPGIRFVDGERVQGSRAFVRALDARVPSPALLPADPAAWGVAELPAELADLAFLQFAAR